MNTTTTITLSDHAVNLLSLEEVARQMLEPTLKPYELIGECEMDGDEIAVKILISEPLDPRIDGHIDRYENITLANIRTDFCEGADYCTWAKDENGDDVLACFGNY